MLIHENHIYGRASCDECKEILNDVKDIEVVSRSKQLFRATLCKKCRILIADKIREI